MTDDAELLIRYARDQSEPAFAEFVRRHIDLVYSAALRRVDGDPHRAAEVTQQVFLSLARRAQALSRHPVLAAWLHASTRNAASNLLRAERRREFREKLAMKEIEPSSRPSPEWQQLRSVLDDAVDGLSERDRRALIMRFFEGRSYAELGSILSLREEAARMRVGRAVERLRIRLARRGITSTAAALSMALVGQTVSAAPAGLAASITSAVTSAAPALFTAAGLIQLMTTTKTALVLGSTAILLVVGAALRNTIAEIHLQADLTTANRSAAAANDQLQDLRRRARTATRAPSSPSKVGAAPVTRASAGAIAAMANAENLMARHPEVRRAWDRVYRANTATGAHNLLRASSLNLTAEQEEQLENAMMLGNIIIGTYADSGKSYTFGTGRSMVDPEPAIAAVLGGKDQYRELQRTFDSRNIASDLAAATLEEAVPLAPDQIRQVAEVIAGNSPPYQRGGAVYAGSIDWDEVVAQAKNFLSPAQQAVLAEERQQIQFNAALRAATTTSPQG